MADNIADCPVCGFPVKENPVEGEALICANCGVNLIADGITIPTGFFWGCVAFIAGIFLGPSIVASSERGRAWLKSQAKGG